jgi:hypothetical protein
MKLATYMAEIEWAYQDLIHNMALSSIRPAYSFAYQPHHPAHIIPRERQHSHPLQLAPNYNPMDHSVPFASKEKLVLSSAFQSTYHDQVMPLTHDMVPVVIDTGASISISPYNTDFIGKIHPVQNVTLNGIASGLPVAGIGTIQYHFINDKKETQTITLNRCLYVPKCTIWLLCPQQIGYATGCPSDGFNATASNPVLTVHGESTTLQYDSLSNLPLLYTTPGITSFQRYVAHLSTLKASPRHPTNELTNLTRLQRRKLYLHECCAHESFGNLNQWIHDGRFKDVPPSLANLEDPECITCNFGKAW